MSDTFFTAPPHWQWLVILYFFFGGLAGGSYLIAVVADPNVSIHESKAFVCSVEKA